MGIFTIGQTIGRYRVEAVLATGAYDASLRVADPDGGHYFMKVYALDRTPPVIIDDDLRSVKPIRRCEQVDVCGLPAVCRSENATVGGTECFYAVMPLLEGETLAQRLGREGAMKPDEALTVYGSILKTLSGMHGGGLCHNAVSPAHVMVGPDASQDTYLVGLSHVAAPSLGTAPFDVGDLDPTYCAGETFACVYDEQNDIFAATAVLYAMLTGHAPWSVERTEGMSRVRYFSLLKDKRQAEPLDLDGLGLGPRVADVVRRGLALRYSDRFETVDDVRRALAGAIEPQQADAGTPPSAPGSQEGKARGHATLVGPRLSKVSDYEFTKGGGGGFKDVAGMDALKQDLQRNVIFVIKERDLARRYRIQPPNGLLLYGPPGCGKTYFAQKFAEETGYNYLKVRSSDLASVYVHGTQEKIADLFRQAADKAPVVLCFDEFDALVPSRSSDESHHRSSEVNEFLSQLDHCSARGIFVIGTTNRPDKIDPAVLRTGRIDKQVYVPLPDRDVRREMFRIHLQDRPLGAASPDLDALADLTERYVSSDIAYIVNDAAIAAAIAHTPITQALIEQSVAHTPPSVGRKDMAMYDRIREQMARNERRNIAQATIGFRPVLPAASL